jgi:hypothetical protein
VTGGGGKQVYAVAPQPFSAFAAMVYLFVQVQVNGSSLRLEAINSNGQVFDTVELQR